jgi:glucan phosphoethanolaminetransferase (alkaline phosphatase superfamily)
MAGILSGLITSAYFLGLRPSSKELARYNVGRLFEILSLQQPEYLFLLGISLITAAFLVKRFWIASLTTALITAAWVIYYESFSAWLLGLGADSFSETQIFDLHEALFFIPSMLSIFVPFIAYRRLTLYIIVGFFIFYALIVLRRKAHFSRQTMFFFCLLTGLCLSLTALSILATRVTSSYRSNTEIFNTAAKNFDHPGMSIVFNRPLNVVVYIGESTTVMNMGLYGYPRDTTPNLIRLAKEDDGLLIFKNVLSTFTHTSDSLLEALSIGLQTDQDLLPITLRARISLPDLLQHNHIPSYLLSNQGEEGTWNMAGSIIFKHAQKQYSVTTTRLGNAEYMIDRPYDGDFFLKNLDVLLPTLSATQSSVVFLHSFAGHGGMNGYLGAIPEAFRSNVDHYLKNKSDAAIAGSVRGATENVENYDSAMRYIDHNINLVIEKLNQLEKPTVFIYFSDHGESVYTARGHESSRFTHEMARVPLLIFFNASARQQYPLLFKQYKQLAETNTLTTLAQIPATVIDLLGGQTAESRLVLPKVIGTKQNSYISPIVVRSTSSGDTYVNTNNADVLDMRERTTAPASNVADEPTRIFVARQTNLLDKSSLCYSGVDTLAMTLRGAMVSDCLQLNIVLNAKRELSLRVSNKSVSGMGVEAAVEIAYRNKLALWLQVSELDQPGFCQQLLTLVQPTLVSGRAVLVSLNSETLLTNLNTMNCLRTLKQNGVFTAYSLPHSLLLACANTPAPPDALKLDTCPQLTEKIELLKHSNLFTDLSFDVEGLRVVKQLNNTQYFRWNITHVEPRKLLDIETNRFRMVGLNARDLNALQ